MEGVSGVFLRANTETVVKRQGNTVFASQYLTSDKQRLKKMIEADSCQGGVGEWTVLVLII